MEKQGTYNKIKNNITTQYLKTEQAYIQQEKTIDLSRVIMALLFDPAIKTCTAFISFYFIIDILQSF